MADIALNYSEYLEDRYKYGLKGPSKSVQRTEHKKPTDVQKFFSRRGYCPFCRKDTDVVFDDSDYSGFGSTDFIAHITIWECRRCGWWECKEKSSEEVDLIDKVNTINWETLRYSIVKRYNVADTDPPIKELVEVLRKNKDLLYTIEPHKLETVAQYVFSSYFDCEVKHVGRSHDGGIDLIVAKSDNPILVQVKRRGRSDSTESVSTVREFIGAVYLKNAANGIVLSTAKRFSKEARLSAQQMVDDRKFVRFDLIDFERFCAMLDVIKKDDHKTWRKFEKKVWHSEDW